MNTYHYMSKLPYPTTWKHITGEIVNVGKNWVPEPYMPIEAIRGENKNEKIKFIQNKWYEANGREGWRECFITCKIGKAYETKKSYEEYLKTGIIN